jgi:hypothetical protein
MDRVCAAKAGRVCFCRTSAIGSLLCYLPFWGLVWWSYTASIVIFFAHRINTPFTLKRLGLFYCHLIQWCKSKESMADRIGKALFADNGGGIPEAQAV